MYRYGIIGNCSTVALIDDRGSIDWLCLPSADSPPFFGRLLDPAGGHCTVTMPHTTATRQRYVENTNILETELQSSAGMVRITDLSPRSLTRGRIHRPREVVRRIEPIAGTPQVAIACRPVAGWEREPLKPYIGSQAIHYETGGTEATISTTLPPGDIITETLRPLTKPEYVVITHGCEPIGALQHHAEAQIRETMQYWHTWVKSLTLPKSYDRAVIRSALTLKLNCFEDTGAILAAPSTSLPEEFGGERNWDYRYCWLRDAAFILTAFRHLGQIEEMQGFLNFLLEIAGDNAVLRPVYRADRTPPLPEEIHLNWRGFNDSRPIRSGNQAAEHVQNDVYGEMLCALTPICEDRSFSDLSPREHSDLIRYLARKAAETIGAPDAGLWEFRSQQQVHAFTALTAWAGLRSTEGAIQRGYLPALDFDPSGAMKEAIGIIERSVVEGSVRNGPTDPSFDASLLLLPRFGYTNRRLSEQTVLAVHRALNVTPADPRSPHLYRYRRTDDFGIPHSSFVICSYWLIEALALLGHRNEAKRMMTEMTRCENHLGLLAEHIDPVTMQQSGNFPQAYSHVGLINAAFALDLP